MKQQQSSTSVSTGPAEYAEGLLRRFENEENAVQFWREVGSHLGATKIPNPRYRSGGYRRLSAKLACGALLCAALVTFTVHSHAPGGSAPRLLQGGLTSFARNPMTRTMFSSPAGRTQGRFMPKKKTNLDFISPERLSALEKVWRQAGSPTSLRAQVDKAEEQEVDLFRETLIRYLGYANEMGEAFRGFIGSTGVLASYGVASGYVVSDSIYQSIKVAKKEAAKGKRGAATNMRVAATGIESLVWQTLASVAIPGYTINRAVALAHFALDNLYKTDAWAGIDAETTSQVDHWGPTLFGLVMIPLIVRPIDTTVEGAFDKYVRPPIEKFLDEFEANNS